MPELHNALANEAVMVKTITDGNDIYLEYTLKLLFGT
jgi:hypothetical protein